MIEAVPSADDPLFGRRFAYVLSRWRFAAAVISSAALLTLIVSELLPKRYTATAAVIVEPPAGNDARISTAVNPTYLDSLRTFERFFTSDTLFQEAAEHFHLEVKGPGIAALKKRILKVMLVHDTRILEVSVTLGDPGTATDLVRYITAKSIATSRDEALNGDRETLANLNAELEQARTRLEKAQAASQAVAMEDAPGAMESEISAETDLSSELRRREAEAEVEAAEWQVRAQHGAAADAQYAVIQAHSASAAASAYARRQQQLRAEMSKRQRLLAAIAARRATATTELDAALESYAAAEKRVRDFSSLLGLRSERLHMIDAGVVPTQPSSPKVLLNTVAAMLLAALCVAGWLGLTADRPAPKAEPIRASRRLA